LATLCYIDVLTEMQVDTSHIHVKPRRRSLLWV